MVEGAFSSYDYLTSVTFDKDSYITELPNYAFVECESLYEVNLSPSILSIGNYAFADCYNLHNLNITKDSNLASIGLHAFENCYSLSSLYLPETLTSIGEDAFGSCTYLDEVYVDSLSIWLNIEFGSHYANPLCNSSSTDSDNHYRNRAKLYVNNELLTDAVIPSDIVELKNYAFVRNSYLVSVSFEEATNLTTINSEVFMWCYNLLDIVIPQNVVNIAYHAFYGAENLVIYFEATEDAEAGFADGWNSDNLPVIWDCNNNNLDADGYEYIVVDDLRYAIKDNEAKLVGYLGEDVNVVIPESVTYNDTNYAVTAIGANVFEDMDIESVSIPSSIKYVETCAFDYCYNLDYLYIEDLSAWFKIEFANEYSNPMFYSENIYLNGELLTILEIPNDITEVYADAFYSNSNIEYIIIPSTVSILNRHSVNSGTSLVLYAGESIPAEWDPEWDYSGNTPVFGYTGNDITYSFTVNGGMGVDSIVSKYPITLPTATRTGYLFVGWYEAVNLSGDLLTSPYYSSSDIKLNACWISLEHLEVTNDDRYPFAQNGSGFTSTNHTNSSTSNLTIKAKRDMELSFMLEVSSERNFDKLTYQKFDVDGNLVGDAYVISGLERTAVMDVNLLAGEYITISYGKDGSESSYDDCGSIRLIDISLTTID